MAKLLSRRCSLAGGIGIFVNIAALYSLYGYGNSILGPSQYGSWLLCLSCFQLIRIIEYPISTGLVRLLAAENDEKTNSSYIAAGYLVSGVSGLSFMCFALCLLYFGGSNLLIERISWNQLHVLASLLSISSVFYTATIVPSSLLVASGRTDLSQIALIVARTVGTVVTVLLLIMTKDICAAAFGELLFAALSWVLSECFVVKYSLRTYEKFQFRFESVLELFHSAAPVAMETVSTIFVLPVNKWLVGSFCSPSDVPTYDLVVRSLLFIRQLTAVVTRPIIPELIRLKTGTEDHSIIQAIVGLRALTIKICLFIGGLLVFGVYVAKTGVEYAFEVEMFFLNVNQSLIYLAVACVISVAACPAYHLSVAQGNSRLIGVACCVRFFITICGCLAVAWIEKPVALSFFLGLTAWTVICTNIVWYFGLFSYKIPKLIR